MDSSRNLGTIGVLSEALCLPNRNKKLMLPSMILALIPSSLLLLGNHLSIYPLLLDFIMKLHSLSREYPTTPQFYDLLLRIKSDASAMSHVDVALIICSFFASLLSMMIVVHASAAACSARHLLVQDLFLKIKGAWKGPLVTFLYSTLLSVGYTVLSVSLIAVPILNMSGSAQFIALSVAVAILARFFYVYLAMVWMVGLVISILENGCHGLEALQKAGEVVKGRRMQGLLIAIVLLLGDGVVTGGYSFGGTNQKWREVLVCTVYLVLKTFSPMVYTVFYRECNKSQRLGVIGELPNTKMDSATIVDDGMV